MLVTSAKPSPMIGPSRQSVLEALLYPLALREAKIQLCLCTPACVWIPMSVTASAKLFRLPGALRRLDLYRST